MNDLNIIVGDCREELAKLSEQSVQCVVTSPPYWGQRDYGVNGMIGLEPEYAAMSRKRIVERVGATSPDALKPDEQAQGRLI